MGEVTLKNGKKLEQRHEKKKHYWWRYLLTFFGGFLACIGVIVGGIAITGTVIKLKDLVAMTGQDPSTILGDEYQDLTLLQTVMKLSGTKFETLGDINKVTPKVQEAVEVTLNPILKDNLGYEFDWTELSRKPFTVDSSSTRPEEEYDKTQSLGDYIPEALESGITLHGLLTAKSESEVSKMMSYFLYPTVDLDEDGVPDKDGEGNIIFDTEHPYSILDIMSSGSGFFDDIIGKIRIGDIIDTSGSPFLAQMADWTTSNFTDANIKSLQIGLMFSEEERNGNPLLKALSENVPDGDHPWTINDLSNMDNINKLKIGQIIDTTAAGTSEFIKSIANNTIKDLTSAGFVDSLEIKSVFPSATGILKTLSGKNTEYKKYIKDPGGYVVDGLAVVYTDTAAPTPATHPEATPRGEPVNEHPGDGYAQVDGEGNLVNFYVMTTDGWTRFKNYTIGDLNVNDNVMDLTLGEVFGSNITPGSILESFKDDTLKQIGEKDVNTIRIVDVFPDYATNKILNAVVTKYGTDGATIGKLSDQATIDGLALKDLITAGDSKVLQTLLARTGDDTVTIGNISTAINSLTLKDAIDVGTNPNAMIYKIAYSEALVNTPLSGIGAQFGNLKMSDIFTLSPSSPQVLVTLCNGGYTLNTLENGLKNMVIGDVMTLYPGDIYHDTVADKYYVKENSGWVLLEGARLTEEYKDYYGYDTGDPVTHIPGYVELGKAHEYIGNAAPGSIAGSKARDTLYGARNTNINDPSGIFDALKSTITLDDVITIDNSSPKVLQSLKGCKLEDISTRISTMKLSDLIDVSGSDSNILGLLADVTVFGDGNDNLVYAIEHLSLVDVLGDSVYKTSGQTRNGVKINIELKDDDINSDGTLKNAKGKDLGDDVIGELGIADIEFTFNKSTREYFTNYLYSYSNPYNEALLDTSLDDCYIRVMGSTYTGAHANHKITFEKESSGTMYTITAKAFQVKEIDASMWLLLTEEGETFNSYYKNFLFKKGYTYSIDDMGQLVDNMNYHIRNDNLRTLAAAGLIDASFDLDAVLKTSITIPNPMDPGHPTIIVIPHGGEKVGDLNVSQLMDVLGALIPLITG